MSQTLCLLTAGSVWPGDKIIITSMHFAYYKQHKTKEQDAENYDMTLISHFVRFCHSKLNLLNLNITFDLLFIKDMYYLYIVCLFCKIVFKGCFNYFIFMYFCY